MENWNMMCFYFKFCLFLGDKGILFSADVDFVEITQISRFVDHRIRYDILLVSTPVNLLNGYMGMFND